MLPKPQSPSSSSIDEGRFPAGTLLAGRYRVIALVGRGGMGEVYRANDLKLNQAVALKFLSNRKAINEQTLGRFHNEVRIARQVSHPNVCRVYDIGETEGHVYISMEYVDGEDLGSLLRRIGRLPADKALEIARRLCAGLAAAHDKGVLHRDLKPANVMIDGRGQVIITDFGLAGVAGQVAGGEVRNGTPAYMAPEQLAGKEVSVQSDLYGLGLVLYEMFTGRRAFEDATRRPPAAPSSVVKDIEPSVERVIKRCIEEDPRSRPSSALAVAVALPGADRLAAALAAGETPSPDAVAAATDTGAISVRTAAILMTLVLAGLAGVVALGSYVSILQKTPFEKSGVELAARSRELIRMMGYTERPADFAYGFSFDRPFLLAGPYEKPATYRAQLSAGQPSPIYFWYRQSPWELNPSRIPTTGFPTAPDGVVTEWNPREDQPKMVDINLDPEGRLTFLVANPPAFDESPDLPVRIADWASLFRAAGLDQSRFVPVAPKAAGPWASDTRAAWSGSLAHAPEVPITIEAASWKGRPTRFWVIYPWAVPDFSATSRPTTGQRIQTWSDLVARFGLFAIALLLAVRNFRQKKGDTRGALRLSLAVLCISILTWAFSAKHHADSVEYQRFGQAVSLALFQAAAFGVVYVALEPYVRRHWPQSLISWTRVLAGTVRDPLVGSHALIGIVIGLGTAILFYLENLLVEPYASIQYGPDQPVLFCLLGTRWMAAASLEILEQCIGIGLFILFLAFLLRVLLRKDWLAVGAGAAMVGVFYGQQSAHVLPAAGFMILVAAISLVQLIRYGVLPLIVQIVVSSLLPCFPMTLDFSSWYAGSTLFALTATLCLATWAFVTALAGRPLIRTGLLDE